MPVIDPDAQENPTAPPYRLSKPLKFILVAAGFLALGLGILGIVLPVLPTTPFLLLAAACFLRSSRRLYYWITGHRIFGPPIVGYLKYRAVSRWTKIFALATLWLVIGITAIFVIHRLWLRVTLGGIAAGVTVHLLLMKTLTPDMRAEMAAEIEKR